jgi:endo-1,4-beta-xylanase
MRAVSVVCLLVACTAPPKPRATANEPVSLARLAKARGKHFGTAVRVEALRNDPRYVRVIKGQFDTLVLENEMKMRHVQPSRGVFRFDDADFAVAFARDNGMKMRGHTLVWAESIPDWVIGTPDELAEIMHRHIQTEVSHFKTLAPGVVYAWDVVNEAFDDRDDIRDDLPFKKIGNGKDDVIRLAFRWAREADPDAKLFYSDYGIETINDRSDAAYAMIRSMRNEGVPIDGVSFHMHLRSERPRSPNDVAASMARFAALGLEIQVTEFDDRLPVANGASREALDEQASVYEAMARVCMQQPACTLFMTWGFTDAYSWIPESDPGHGSALYFDESFRPKPAFFGLVRALSR